VPDYYHRSGDAATVTVAEHTGCGMHLVT